MTQKEAFEKALKETEVKHEDGTSSVCVNDYAAALVKNLKEALPNEHN